MQVLNALSVAEGTRTYTRLRADVIEAGILEKSYLYYAFTIAFGFGGFAASAAGIFFFDNILLLALSCLGFTFFSVQLAGINHDSGHRAIFKSIRLNNLMGVACSFCLGIVFDNWRVRHNEHHARPNQPSDPDLYVPFLVTDPNQLASKTGLEASVLKYQAFYYYPLGALVSFSNRLGTISYFRRRPLNRDDLWRFPLYGAGVIFLFVSPFLLFDPLKALFVFFFVHITSGIYLASCFAPNHKGMTILPDDAQISFLEQQTITGRSVTGGRLTEIMLVGLNHQTEHHLFPSTPRWKLRRITPTLQTVCDEKGIHFERATFIKTNRDILRVLHTVAIEAAQAAPTPSPQPLRTEAVVEEAQAVMSTSLRD